MNLLTGVFQCMQNNVIIRLETLSFKGSELHSVKHNSDLYLTGEDSEPERDSTVEPIFILRHEKNANVESRTYAAFRSDLYLAATTDIRKGRDHDPAPSRFSSHRMRGNP